MSIEIMSTGKNKCADSNHGQRALRKLLKQDGHEKPAKDHFLIDGRNHTIAPYPCPRHSGYRKGVEGFHRDSPSSNQREQNQDIERLQVGDNPANEIASGFVHASSQDQQNRNADQKIKPQLHERKNTKNTLFPNGMERQINNNANRSKASLRRCANRLRLSHTLTTHTPRSAPASPPPDRTPL